jgi:erythromycin esterase-like protein
MSRPSRAIAALVLILLSTSLAAQSNSDLAAIRAAAHPITEISSDYDALMNAIDDKRLVFLGEATHGTAEFHEERARISERLIIERDFRAVAVEGDFRDIARLNDFILGRGSDRDVVSAFGDVTGFPLWMWRNAQFAAFVLWLRQYNASVAAELRVRLIGMDLQNPISSVDALIDYLARTDPAAEARARQRYGCFDPYRDDMLQYGYASPGTPPRVCRQPAIDEFNEMSARYTAGPVDDALFDALQDARVVMNGETYYGVIANRTDSSWIVRDRHFLDTLDAIRGHYGAKIAVWTHNTHAGDARATQGVESNVSEFARERWPGETFLAGFSTYAGTVVAAHEWGGEGRLQPLLPAQSRSDAALLHAAIPGNFYLLTSDPVLQPVLGAARLQRAVGVVYLPETELQSHYLMAVIASEFDAVIHIDITRGVDTLLPTFAARHRAVAH